MTTDPFTVAEQLHRLCPSLAAEVAKCCEQAYRRGYQQGALYGHGLDEQIANWRFNLDPSIPYQTDLTAHYATASAPPDTRGACGHFQPRHLSDWKWRRAMRRH